VSIDQIASEALKLPARDRALLAESLWASLSDPNMIENKQDDSEAVKLAVERDQEMETGDVEPVSHDQLMSRLRQ